MAQPVINPPGAFQTRPPTGITNLRISNQSVDGTEVVLTMEYGYDGLGGPNALVIPVIEKRGEKGVAAWFGADPVTIGTGKGLISIKVKYFNDEPGVPPQFTSDSLRILVLNRTGTVILSSIPFLKTIKWGSPEAKPTTITLAQAPTKGQESGNTLNSRPQTETEAKARREAQAEAKTIETARNKAEAAAKAREEARRQAAAAAKARREAEQKARAEASAREAAQKKAEAEAKRLADEARKAEEKAATEARSKEKARLAAEAKARNEARLKAEAEARRLAEAKRQADTIAQAEAEARERARLKAETEENLRQEAEQKARAEAATREAARVQAEAESKRLAEEKRLALEHAQAEAQARKVSETKPKANLETNRLPARPISSDVVAERIAALEPLVTNLKTKITNVDVVNRTLDRSQMTIGVEYDYRDNLGPKPMLGVDVTKLNDPSVSRYFVSVPAEVGKSRRNFLLFPIKFQPPSTLASLNGYLTDNLLVYLLEASSAKRFNLYPATMLLNWRPAGSTFSATSKAEPSNKLELEDFRQNDPHTGYVTVKYSLVTGPGKLRVRLFDAKNPASADWFAVEPKLIKAGQGLQIIDVSIAPEANTPSNIVKVDTLTIELVDSTGKIVDRITKELPMTWAKPE